MGCCQALASAGLAVLGHGLGRLAAVAACRRRCRMGGGRLDGRQFCAQLGGASALAATDGCTGFPAVDVAGRPWIWPAGVGLVGFAAGAGGSVSGAGLARCPLVPHTAAGCGQGAGLVELRAEFPDAELVGIEWSRSLRLLCAWRCRWARVRRGDLWGESWADYDLVYLFQRPESLDRAIEKARREMRAGAWLVSLEFSDQATPATTVLRHAGQRPVWLYRMPADGRRQRVDL